MLQLLSENSKCYQRIHIKGDLKIRTGNILFRVLRNVKSNLVGQLRGESHLNYGYSQQVDEFR